jgi:hypothetical protein
MITELNMEHYFIMGLQFAQFIWMLLIFKILKKLTQKIKNNDDDTTGCRLNIKRSVTL